MTVPSPPASTALPYETASWARRILALFVDWIASWGATLLVISIFPPSGRSPWEEMTRTGSPAQWWVLGMYVVESAILTTLAGGSFGKLATRLRTVRTTPADSRGQDPRPLDPLRAFARQIMIAVVVPPLIFKPDGRGLHDLAASTATVTLQTYRSAFLRV